MEDYSPCSDEDINQMEKFLIDRDMEKINEHLDNMQSVEDMEQDP